MFLPTEEERQEYVRSDYGLLYMGSDLNFCGIPWCFAQVGGAFHVRSASLARGKKMTNHKS